MITKQEQINKSRACLIMGAIGDALGAPVEFMSNEQIKQTYGDTGIQFHAEAYGHKGAITDDTQMTLMCADGLLNAYRRGSERGILGEYWNYIALSYVRWLETQGGEYSHYGVPEDWGNKTLYELLKAQGSRAPGTTCISALSKMPNPVAAASNDSKGCGTVMRIAPVGIFFGSLYGISTEELEKIYQEGMKDASITHGNVTAQHASGILAVIIALCLNGEELLGSIEKALKLFGMPDVADICNKAMSLSTEPVSIQGLTSLGEGWIAEEALAMSIYCALQCSSNGLPSVDALRLAVNHGGDSDSTGAITGNLIGISLGMQAIPEPLLSEDTEVGSMLGLLTTYGEELITRPSRVISNIH
jgi:ADP-ribosyl-[dinitrogen reductase] hydrolase